MPARQPKQRTAVALSVTVDGAEVFRVASDGRGVMPGDDERAAVLCALTNGLSVLLGTDLTGEPLNASISVRRATPGAMNEQRTDTSSIRRHLTDDQVELIQRAATCLRLSDISSDWDLGAELEKEFGCERD